MSLLLGKEEKLVGGPLDGSTSVVPSNVRVIGIPYLADGGVLLIEEGGRIPTPLDEGPKYGLHRYRRQGEVFVYDGEVR